MQGYLGEFSALLVAVFWTVTAIAFERASVRIGSLSLNVIRLFMGLFFLTLFVWLRRGMPFPTDASGFNWFWLAVSGLVGFVFGDLFLFKSYPLIGSRFAMLIMTLAPPMAAIAGWIGLGEKLLPLQILGMFLTLLGISLAYTRQEGNVCHCARFIFRTIPRGFIFPPGHPLYRNRYRRNDHGHRPHPDHTPCSADL
jgi:drug/metabolite transporter (DMT)-like permease